MRKKWNNKKKKWKQNHKRKWKKNKCKERKKEQNLDTQSMRNKIVLTPKESENNTKFYFY